MTQPERRAARNASRPYRESSKGVTKAGKAKKNRRSGVGRWPLHDKKMFLWYHGQSGTISESTIRAQATIFFREIYEGNQSPVILVIRSNSLKVYRCRGSLFRG